MKYAAIFLIGILLVGIYTHTGVKNEPNPDVNYRQKPRITNYQDKALDLSSLKLPPSDFILLGVWATWCPTCKPELQVLNTLQKKWSRESLKIISLNVDPIKDQDKVQTLWRLLELSMPLIQNPSPKLLRSLDVEVLPSYLLVKDNSKLVLRIDGATNWNDPETLKAVDAALSSSLVR